MGRSKGVRGIMRKERDVAITMRDGVIILGRSGDTSV